MKIRNSRRSAPIPHLLALAAALMGAREVMAQTPPAANTLPQGGQVVQGQATLQHTGTAAAPVLNVQQSSQRAVINWTQFNLGRDATVNFNQPNVQAATLNRVQDMAPSQILGRINAPGQVTLINPAGVYFSPHAVLDVGALAVSTLNQSDADFMAGRAQFSRQGATGSVVNEGTLRAGLGGYVALLAPEVRNQGVIVAQAGSVALAAGEAVTLNFDAQSKLASVTVSAAQIATLVENRQAVLAEGGLIVMAAHAAQGLASSVVQAGTANASSVASRGGRILLEADSVTLAAGSRTEARGATAGGTVLAGGDWQGGGTMRQASTVTMAASALVDVSATDQGNGGTAVLWSDVHRPQGRTQAAGTVVARGGALGGDGGRVETSGHQLDIDGFRVDTRATSDAVGRTGVWLIDPYDYTIGSAQAATIGTALNTSDVTVTTSSNVAGFGSNGNNASVGDITVNSSIARTGGSGTTTLTLQSARSVVMNAGTSISGAPGAPLNVVFWADSDSAGGGGVFVRAVDTQGGHLYLGGGSSSTTWNGLTVPNGPSVTITTEAPIAWSGNLSTGGGSVYLWSGTGTTGTPGTGDLFVISNSTINAGSGDITLRLNSLYRPATPTITTTGRFSLLPSTSGGSFGTALNTNSFAYGATLGGLTVGAPGNTANVTLGAAHTVNGPVALYGGTVTLGGNLTTTHTGTGDVTVNATTGLTGSGNIALAEGRTLTVAQAGNTTYSGVISGTLANVVKDGAGDLSLAGAHTYGGSTTVNAGVLSLGAANRLPDGTALTVNAAGTFSLNGLDETVGSIAGNGLIVNGAVVRDGLVLWLDAGNTASYNGTGNTWYDLSGNGYNATLYGSPSYNAGTSLFSFTSNTQYAQIATLPANFLGNTVTGVTVFTVANFGTAQTWERVVDLGNTPTPANTSSNNIILSRNALSDRLAWEFYNGVGGAASYHSIANNTAITNSVRRSYVGTADGANLRIYRDGVLNTTTASTALPNAIERSSNFIGRSNWAQDDTFRGDIGTLMVYNRALSQTEIARNHQLLFARAAATLTVGGNNTSTTFGGRIENGVGTLNVVKEGSGTLTLSGANTYAGTTTVQAGTLRNGASAAVPRFSAVNVAAGATWDLNNLDHTVASVTGSGSIALGSGTLSVGGLNSSFAFGGTLSGTGGLVKEGSGTFTLSGANTYSGATTVSAGTLASGAAGALSDDSAFSVAALATLNLAGYDDALGSLAGNGNVNLGAATLTAGGNNTSTAFGGVLSGTGGLIKAGSGTMTLTGINTYSGTTTVSAGTLNVGGGGATGTLGSGAVTTHAALVVNRTGDVVLSALMPNAAGIGGSGFFSATAGAGLTIDRPISVTGNISLTASGGNLAIDRAVLSGGTATLAATGTVSDGASGSLTAPQVAITGGEVTLDAAATDIGTLAANGVSLVRVRDSNALTLGTVGATVGISASGDIDISTASGDLMVAAGVATTATGSSALVLNAGRSAAAGTASGGSLLISGSPSLSVGSGGRGTLYSGSIAGSTGLATLVGSGSQRFRYHSDESASNYTLALGSGLHAVFREQPTLTFTVNNQTMTYGDVRPADSVAFGGLANGDTVARALSTLPTVSGGVTTSTAGHLTAGNHTLTAAGAVLGGLGYALGSYTGGTLTVAPRSLTATVTGVSRAYDGSTVVSVTTGDNRLGGDVLSVAVAAANLASPNVGNGVALTASGLNLSGADAGNYTLASTTAAGSADITPRLVNVSGLAAAPRMYDGSTGVNITNWGSVATGVAGESITLVPGMASFANGNAGLGRLVTASGYTLTNGTGGLASNYQLVSASATTTADITPRTVSISGLTVASRVYDGSTSVNVTHWGDVVTGVAGESITLVPGTASLANANAGLGRLVNASGYTLANGAGGLASNYQLASPAATTTVDITPRTVSIRGLVAAPRVYDGSTGVTITDWGSVATGVVGESITLVPGIASFADANASTARLVTASGYALANGTGGLASNYQLASSTATTTADITPRTLSIAGLAAAPRAYDGSTSANITHWGHVATGVASESLTLVPGTARFADANAGSARLVTASGYTLADGNGGRASNYQLANSTATTTADITPAPLTVRANADARFVSQADAAGYAGASFVGFVAGEGPQALGGGLTIQRSNAGIQATGHYAGVLQPSGLTSSNYAIRFEAGDYTIVPAQQLLVRVAPGSSTYGSAATHTVASASYLAADHTTIVDLTARVQASGNDIRISDGAGGVASLVLGLPHAARSGAGVVGAGTWSVDVSSAASTSANFSDTLVVVGNHTVTPRNVAIQPGAVSRVYDGTTWISGLGLPLLGLLDGDVVSASGHGLFASRDVGTGIGYQLNQVTLGGADAANYRIAGGLPVVGDDGRITARTSTAPPVDLLGSTAAGAAALVARLIGEFSTPATGSAPGSRAGLRADSASSPGGNPSGGGDISDIDRAGGAAAASDATGGSGQRSGALIVQVREARDDGAGLVLVQLHARSSAARGFSVTLPPQTEEAARRAGGQPQATLADGQPLPGWLRFAAGSMRFEADAVPQGALPLRARVAAGSFSVVVEIRDAD